VPNSFAQIAVLQPDALIVDIVVGQRVGWDLLERLQAEVAPSGI
jgi:DNA-binding NarL/FixJ family response regulator